MIVIDKWVRPTRRPAELLVDPTNLVGGAHDLINTFQKIPHTTLFRATTRLDMQDKTLVDFDQADRRVWQVL
jgi:hypothetical protein